MIYEHASGREHRAESLPRAVSEPACGPAREKILSVSLIRARLVAALSRRESGLLGLVFSIAVVALLVWGWSQRDEFWFTAEEGWGYAFGIIGASLMALLMLYPARKHWKPMRRLLPIRYWFQLHMLFGIVGPVFILFHSNFHLGSLNSNVALFSMLTVAGSGLIGRYVYRQIHRGLYGAQIEFGDLRKAYQNSRALFVGNALVDERTAVRLQRIELTLVDRSLSLRGSIWARYALRRLRRGVASKLAGALHSGALPPEQIRMLKTAYAGWRQGSERLERMARYAVFARLFSLWHILHLPIFFMMLVAATVHIVVVHMY